jgi:hypothetical protein
VPNFDTGHLFLTTLAPIKNGGYKNSDGVRVSYQQQVRIILSAMPTALQSPATVQMGYNSPFSRNTRNHLCRFMVLDDVIYDGRDKVVPVIGQDPLTPTAVDTLDNAYLMYAADIDAVTKDGEPLPDNLTAAQQDAARDSYARKLWETMEAELRLIYSNCVGFDEVNSADDFAKYLAKCQVETTMPFNDYWLPGDAKFHVLPQQLLLNIIKWPLIVAGLGLVAFLAKSLLGQLNILPRFAAFLAGFNPGWIFIVGLGVGLIAIYGAYKYALSNGEKPMSAGRYADLPNVLKSLYLQQNFADFAVAQQGCTPAELHEAFGQFLADHKPEDKMTPTQCSGVISIKPEHQAK